MPAGPEWPSKSLGELGARITSGSRGWAKNYSDHGDLFVRITNLKRDNIRIDLSDTRFVRIDPSDSEALRTRLAAGDLLISITADIGIIGYVDANVPTPAYINQHIARVRLDPAVADSKFVAYYLSSWGPQRAFLGATDTGAKAGLNLPTVARLETVVPSLGEQRQIAEAISDTDALIGKLEQLVAKATSVSRGLIDALLGGSTRLQGFDEGWRDAMIGDVAYGLRGSGLSKDQVSSSGSNPCVLYGELFTTYGRLVSTVRSRTDVDTGVRSASGDVLVPGSTTTIARDLATASALESAGVLIGGDTNILRPGPDVDPEWLAYVITHRLGDQVARVAQGTTIKHLYVRDLLNCEIPMPSVQEQRAIAAALHDAEDDVAAVQAKLAKVRAIKQGMMQQLLTGRVRLSAEVAA